jgi:cell wall-associated NlpC family hydrolase
MLVYQEFGVSLPHSAAGQYGYGVEGSGAAGDLVFFGSGGITHVGIVVGGDSMIHAPYGGRSVEYGSISAVGNAMGLVGYRTLL